VVRKDGGVQHIVSTEQCGICVLNWQEGLQVDWGTFDWLPRTRLLGMVESNHLLAGGQSKVIRFIE